MAKKRISNSERKRRKKLQILKDSKEFGNQSRLADEILMALNNPEMIAHYHTKSRSQDRNENKIWFKEQERKRKSFIDMFSAVPKFHISNGLVESVVHSSFQKPSKLLPRFSNARPSYEEVFIEWNEIHRARVLNDYMVNDGYNMMLDESELPYRVGYYIQTLRHPDGEVMFVFSQFSSLSRYELYIPHWNNKEFNLPPNVLVLNPFAFMYSPVKPLEFDLEATIDLYKKQGMTDEYINTWKNADKEKMTSDYEKMQQELMVTMLGDNYLQTVAQDTGKRFTKNGRGMIETTVPKEMLDFSKRIQMFNHMMSYLIYSSEEMSQMQQEAENSKMFHNSYNGDARFLLTLLDILNQSELVEQNSIDRSKQLQYSKGLKRIPHSEYKVLNLSLPNQIQTREPNPDANGSPKRYHQRRGHWRHLRNGKTIWIKDKWVGNQELGTIYHDYNLLRKVH